MDKSTFIELFNKDGWQEAMGYKDRFVPKVLYKYYPLFDNRYVEHERENQIRLNSLGQNEIWISSYEKFNDPFEFKMLTLDRERLELNGWDIGYIERILEEFKKRTMIACFSSGVENNMPLWAHYANNHSGYCVKYSIINPRSLFPVSYEPVRTKTAIIPTKIISEIVNSFKQNLMKPTDDFYKYFSYFYISLCCKHLFWEYENEYRLLYPTIDPVDGKLVPLSNVGMKVEGIYIGSKSEDTYKKELISIGKKLNCDVFEMYFDEYSEEFELKTRQV
ncbi:DUF2971 domain-containing protein [Niallia sp. Sow4_A1]|uniref:DUF2971 domain-containing protein n=1 Tax=Niallia sp. Sow4_A1 TaxID=3438793 RepID=UPI003F99A62A